VETGDSRFLSAGYVLLTVVSLMGISGLVGALSLEARSVEDAFADALAEGYLDPKALRSALSEQGVAGTRWMPGSAESLRIVGVGFALGYALHALRRAPVDPGRRRRLRALLQAGDVHPGGEAGGEPGAS
jgi:hypothetical protein